MSDGNLLLQVDGAPMVFFMPFDQETRDTVAFYCEVCFFSEGQLRSLRATHSVQTYIVTRLHASLNFQVPVHIV